MAPDKTNESSTTYFSSGNGGGSSLGINSLGAVVHTTTESWVPSIPVPAPKMDDHPALLDLRSVVGTLTEALRIKYGPRSAVILMVCIPHPDDPQHDLFSSHVLGSCMTARGLLDWGKRFVMDRLNLAISKGGKCST